MKKSERGNRSFALFSLFLAKKRAIRSFPKRAIAQPNLTEVRVKLNIPTRNQTAPINCLIIIIILCNCRVRQWHAWYCRDGWLNWTKAAVRRKVIKIKTICMVSVADLKPNNWSFVQFIFINFCTCFNCREKLLSGFGTV